jgi:hypothetical protein
LPFSSASGRGGPLAGMNFPARRRRSMATDSGGGAGDGVCSRSARAIWCCDGGRRCYSCRTGTMRRSFAVLGGERCGGCAASAAAVGAAPGGGCPEAESPRVVSIVLGRPGAGKKRKEYGRKKCTPIGRIQKRMGFQPMRARVRVVRLASLALRASRSVAAAGFRLASLARRNIGAPEIMPPH